jgi:hypothetical protein
MAESLAGDGIEAHAEQRAAVLREQDDGDLQGGQFYHRNV